MGHLVDQDPGSAPVPPTVSRAPRFISMSDAWPTSPFFETIGDEATRTHVLSTLYAR